MHLLGFILEKAYSVNKIPHNRLLVLTIQMNAIFDGIFYCDEFLHSIDIINI